VGQGALAAPAVQGAVIPVSHAEPSIKNLEIDQHTLFVAVGATITWHNDDQVTYMVTSNDGWFHGEVEPGGTFSWQPTKPGVYRYHCESHDNIEGVIVHRL
jgi:plastocyanin